MRSVTLNVELEDGIYTAVGHEMVDGMRFSIIADGASWVELKTEVQAVIEALYFDIPKPDSVHLHLVHDEELLVA